MFGDVGNRSYTRKKEKETHAYVQSLLAVLWRLAERGRAGRVALDALSGSGPVWRVVPLAQQAAEALSPWLVSLLEARQRARLALPDDADVLFQDIPARPLTRAQAKRERASWAQWRLEAELLRLVRLVEAPTALLHRSGWPEWEVRYWALVITLARIGQLHALLTRQPEGQPIPHLLAAAEAVWQRATQAEQAAA